MEDSIAEVKQIDSRGTRGGGSARRKKPRWRMRLHQEPAVSLVCKGRGNMGGGGRGGGGECVRWVVGVVGRPVSDRMLYN